MKKKINERRKKIENGGNNEIMRRKRKYLKEWQTRNVAKWRKLWRKEKWKWHQAKRKAIEGEGEMKSAKAENGEDNECAIENLSRKHLWNEEKCESISGRMKYQWNEGKCISKRKKMKKKGSCSGWRGQRINEEKGKAWRRKQKTVLPAAFWLPNEMKWLNEGGKKMWRDRRNEENRGRKKKRNVIEIMKWRRRKWNGVKARQEEIMKWRNRKWKAKTDIIEAEMKEWRLESSWRKKCWRQLWLSKKLKATIFYEWRKRKNSGTGNNVEKGAKWMKV